MKKVSLFLIVSLFSVFFLTSCLDSSNVSEGTAVGVLDYNNRGSLIIKSSVGDVSATNLETLVLNGTMSTYDCYIFAYRHDADLPENSPTMVEANGFSTISLLGFEDVPKYYMSSNLTDTSTVITDEVPVVDIYESGNPFISDYYFISHIVNHPSDQKLAWNMSYDQDNLSTEVGGSRYYDIFIRAIKSGSSEKTSTQNVAHLNAYNIGGYMEGIAYREKSALGGSYNPSSSRITLRFNYVSAIDEANNNITWRTKIVSDYLVSSFILE